MSGLTLAIFVIAFGFVTAGLVASLTSWTIGRDGRFLVSFRTMGNSILSLLFFMVSGPYFVVSSGISLWRERNVPLGLLGMFLLAGVFWSFCLGVLIVQILHDIGILQN